MVVEVRLWWEYRVKNGEVRYHVLDADSCPVFEIIPPYRLQWLGQVVCMLIYHPCFRTIFPLAEEHRKDRAAVRLWHGVGAWVGTSLIPG